jgi:hypothetical protein
MLYVTSEANAAHVNKREYTEDQDLYSPPCLWDMQSTDNKPRNKELMLMGL